MGHSEEMIQKAIAQENGKVHVNAQSIPEKYQQKRADEAGVIEHIRYPSKDYFLAGKEITKEANVYLPYGYSRDKKVQRALPDARNRRRRSRVGNG